MTQMRTIHLYGELGELFGKTFSFKVNSVAEAIHALCIQIKGFERYLLDSEKNNVGFKVFSGSDQLGEDQLTIYGTSEIKIVPVIGGANAEFRVLVGAVLAVVGYGTTIFGSGPLGAAVGNAGVALMLGGAIEMFIGKPKIPDLDKQDNKPSYAFNGAVNTSAQGYPVPIGYGRLRIGSAVISASFSTKSIMAGYKRVVVEKYNDLTATDYPENFGYNISPPTGWTRRELIASGSANNGFGSTYNYWTYRYYFNEVVMELVPV